MRRYIDADKFRAEFDYNSGYCAAWEFIDKPSDIQFLIDEQPTADVRENVKGEWLHDEVTMNGNTVYTPNAKCSICDCYVFQESNFCPDCGADMRGGC